MAVAPTASTAHATTAPAAAPAIAANAATPAGASNPRRTMGFSIGPTSPLGSRCARWARRSDEPIAASAKGFDQRVRTVRLERDTQATHVHVDGALLDVNMIAPHHVEQLRA